MPLMDFLVDRDLTDEQLRAVLVLMSYVKIHKTREVVITDVAEYSGIYQPSDYLDIFKEISSDTCVVSIFESGEMSGFELRYGEKSTIRLAVPARIGRKKSITASDRKEESVKRVFNFWKKTIFPDGSRVKLTNPRRHAITSALDSGYSVECCERGILGCSKSPYHMGFNTENGAPTERKYNDLPNILRCKQSNALNLHIQNSDGPSLEESLSKIKERFSRGLGRFAEGANADVLESGKVELGSLWDE